MSLTFETREQRQRALTERFLNSAAELHAGIHVGIKSGICTYAGLVGHGAG